MKNLIIAVVLVVASALFAPAQTPTSFSYQGKLTTGSAPANGTFDFQFALCVDDTSPTVAACTIGPILRTGVTVASGLFTTSLDFGTAAFDQPNRFLEIAVRPSSGGAFITLSPRQRIESAPFAIRSNTATFAETALNATSLGGVSSTNYLQRNGDGSQLINVNGGFKWNVVTSNVQALPNNGYILNSASELEITLPTNPAIGDVVKIAAAGSGGWRGTINSGQTVLPKPWRTRDIARDWRAVASSADGQKLVAVGNGVITTSTDAGNTWVVRRLDSSTWQTVASSDDGTKLVAAQQPGFIYTSTDSGVTWTQRGVSRSWVTVASSSDGVKLVATTLNDDIYQSFDSGVTWRASGFVSQSFGGAAMSANGSVMFAGRYNGTGMLRWADFDPVWRDLTNTFALGSFRSIAASRTGARVIGVGGTRPAYSTNTGNLWSTIDAPEIFASVAASGDGLQALAVSVTCQLYTSTNTGQTWTFAASITTTGCSQLNQGTAMSDDGSRMVAVSSGQPIFVNTLGGGANSYMELVYIGSGTYYVTDKR